MNEAAKPIPSQARHRLRLLVLLCTFAVLAGDRGLMSWRAPAWVPTTRERYGLPAGISTVSERTPDRLRVLFVGNSFTRYNGGLALPLRILANAGGVSPTPVIDQDTMDGHSLRTMYDESAAVDIIRQGSWDIVVLQDHSIGPLADPTGMSYYAARFNDEIRRVGAKPVLFMTWALENRQVMQPMIAAAYERVADEINGSVAPVGLAWQRARAARPDIGLYDADKRHPSPAGSYLTACVFYAVLFGKNPEGLPATLRYGKSVVVDLRQDQAAALQQAAWETVTSQGAKISPP